MIHVCLSSCPDGAEAALNELRDYQAEVDDEPSYAGQVEAAQRLWDRKRKNKPISVAREMLLRMCPSSRYCMFCEDSRGSDVEHFRPKALYPEFVFAWANFLYACSLCNPSKSSRFKVFRPDGTILDVTRKQGAPVMAPESGEALLIDPRHEDPLDLMHLDLSTGRFDARHEAGLARERARYTVDLLGLNEREYLCAARQDAFEANESLLRDIGALRQAGRPQAEIARKVNALRRHPHRTVWDEMKRQREKVPKLKALFGAVPEALGW
ncbi:hypothetical protein [Sorangium sp. So ce204]|uniref:hypothetical protein n=1 Tax=Sorangium sp. So ce204 TaxID=3133288 RepID=UPI003F63D644